MRLFWQTATEAELQRWTEWTDQFAKTHEDAAVAHYLKGDAASLRGNWEAAIAAYARALTKSPNHALTFNARGVAYAWKGPGEIAAGFRGCHSSQPRILGRCLCQCWRMVHPNEGRARRCV